MADSIITTNGLPGLVSLRYGPGWHGRPAWPFNFVDRTLNVIVLNSVQGGRWFGFCSASIVFEPLAVPHWLQSTFQHHYATRDVQDL